ncbi:MAG: hypothetical protein V4525_12445 [Pseudomonadota bacterium]
MKTFKDLTFQHCNLFSIDKLLASNADRDIAVKEKSPQSFSEEGSNLYDFQSLDEKGYVSAETVNYSDPYDEFSNLYFDGFEAIETKFDQEWTSILRRFFVAP